MLVRDLERRIAHLEEASALSECFCSQPIVVFKGDPEPDKPFCQQHGRSRLIHWPLGRHRLEGLLSNAEAVEAVHGAANG